MFIYKNKEMVLDALLLDYISNWENKIKNVESYGEMLNLITFSNLRLLGYYKTNDLVDISISDKADYIFNNIFSNNTFFQQLIDFDILLNMILPRSFVNKKRKTLNNAIINLYKTNIVSKKQKKIIIGNYKNIIKKHKYLWLIFMLKYYKIYLYNK